MEENETKIENAAHIFANEAVFRRKLKQYVRYCGEDESNKRLPNAAGFCRFCNIRRSDYAALREVFPLMYDIAESTFIDEALNTKVVNSGAIMTFIHEFNASVTQPEAEVRAENQLRIVLEHDGEQDGE